MLVPHKSRWQEEKGQEGDGKPATTAVVWSYRSTDQVACAVGDFCFVMQMIWQHMTESWMQTHGSRGICSVYGVREKSRTYISEHIRYF